MRAAARRGRASLAWRLRPEPSTNQIASFGQALHRSQTAIHRRACRTFACPSSRSDYIWGNVSFSFLFVFKMRPERLQFCARASDLCCQLRVGRIELLRALISAHCIARPPRIHVSVADAGETE